MHRKSPPPSALLAIFGAIALHAPLRGQPAFVAQRGNVCYQFPGTSGGTVNIPVNGTVPVGHTLVLAVGLIGDSTASSLTDSQSNTWSPIAYTIVLRPPPPRVEILGTTVTTQLTSADQISLTFTSNASGATVAATAVEYSGLAPLPGAIDQTAYAIGTGSSSAVTLPGPTTQASELLVGATVVSGILGFPSIIGYSTGGSAGCTTYSLTEDYQVVSAIGTYGYAWNFGTSVDWGSVLGSLKAAAVPVGLQRFRAE